MSIFMCYNFHRSVISVTVWLMRLIWNEEVSALTLMRLQWYFNITEQMGNSELIYFFFFFSFLQLPVLLRNRWWVGGWAECGVKIKSNENESQLLQSQAGYKYIHIDTRTCIRFSTRGWHYISCSVGGAMRGMYNSSMWDWTRGYLVHPSEPPERITVVSVWCTLLRGRTSV